MIARNSILTILLAASAGAAVIEVPGDQPTIQAGIDAAQEGDTVQLADGVYRWDGNRDLDFGGKDLVLRSAGGDPEACLIDADGSEGSPHRAIDFHSGESAATRVENLGIAGGWWESDYYEGGGGIRCDGGSSPTLAGCLFTGNHGGGLYVRDGGDLTLRGCRFVGNSDRDGGAVTCLSSAARFEDCEFINNSAENLGGALRGQGATLVLEDCRFIGNVAAGGAAIDMIYGASILLERCWLEYNLALASYWSCIVNLHGMVTGEFVDCSFVNNTSGTHGYGIVTSKMSHGILRGCTFHGNNCPSGTLIVFGEQDGLVQNTIIAGNHAGAALSIGSVLELSCTDIWGNSGGDWTGDIAGYLGQDGNVSLDPRFCDPSAGDYHLRGDSPCAPEHSGGCGLIGAWPVGCEVAAAPSSWSRVKILY